MGININWSNKNQKDIEIEKSRERVATNANNNKLEIDKHTNTTNLVGNIAKGILEIAGAILGGKNDNRKYK